MCVSEKCICCSCSSRLSDNCPQTNNYGIIANCYIRYASTAECRIYRHYCTAQVLCWLPFRQTTLKLHAWILKQSTYPYKHSNRENECATRVLEKQITNKSTCSSRKLFCSKYTFRVYCVFQNTTKLTWTNCWTRGAAQANLHTSSGSLTECGAVGSVLERDECSWQVPTWTPGSAIVAPRSPPLWDQERNPISFCFHPKHRFVQDDAKEHCLQERSQ